MIHKDDLMPNHYQKISLPAGQATAINYELTTKVRNSIRIYGCLFPFHKCCRDKCTPSELLADGDTSHGNTFCIPKHVELISQE